MFVYNPLAIERDLFENFSAFWASKSNKSHFFSLNLIKTIKIHFCTWFMNFFVIKTLPIWKLKALSHSSIENYFLGERKVVPLEVKARTNILTYRQPWRRWHEPHFFTNKGGMALKLVELMRLKRIVWYHVLMPNQTVVSSWNNSKFLYNCFNLLFKTLVFRQRPLLLHHGNELKHWTSSFH